MRNYTMKIDDMSIKNQNKSIFVCLMEKSTTTVTDAKVVYRILLGGQCYTN